MHKGQDSVADDLGFLPKDVEVRPRRHCAWRRFARYHARNDAQRTWRGPAPTSTSMYVVDRRSQKDHAHTRGAEPVSKESRNETVVTVGKEGCGMSISY